MDIILLKDLLDKERSRQALQPVGKDVYKEIKEYFDKLNKQINETEDSNKKKLFLIDELNSAEKIFNFFFEKRMGKIINIATRIAKRSIKSETLTNRYQDGMTKYSDNIDNLTKDEEYVLDMLVESIRSAREVILDKVYGKVGDPLNNKANTEKDKIEEIEKNIKEVNDNDKRYTIVRAIEDIPGFVDIDRKKYIIRKEDIVVLSDKVADMLLKKNLVVKINIIIEDD